MPAKISKLPHLDALRFLAALMVVFAHFERFRVPVDGAEFAIRNLGRCGYTGFFTLSGFLITYVLIQEEEIKGRIQIGKFYLRRALRVWPLYYAMTLYEYMAYPSASPDEYHTSLWLSLLLLPNFKFILSAEFIHAAWAWAIGVHEQFYILWPWVLRLRHRLRFALLLTLILSMISIGAYILYPVNGITNVALRHIPFHLISIGSLFGFLAHSDSPRARRFKEMLFSPQGQAIIFIGVIAQLAFATTVDVPVFEPLAIFLGAFILNLGLNPGNFFRIGNPVFNYLGRRSYAIFMVHVFVLRYFTPLARQGKLSWGLTYLFVILGSLLLAEIVYRALEWPFLRLKKKMEVVKKV